MERDHGVAHASHSLAEAVRADALRGHARSVHHHVKLVGEHFRIRKSGALAQLGKITSLIESGIVRPVVDRIFPFSATNEAMDYLAMGRAKGKVVITVK